MECTTVCNVLYSAMILELGSLIVNCQKGSVMKITQMEMGHDPPLLPSATDSAKGNGFAKDDI